MFHWKHSNWVIGVCGGAALTLALADKFGSAYIFWGITAIYAVGCWLASDTLARKLHSSSSLLGSDGKPVQLKAKRSRLWQIAPSLAIFLVFLGFGFWIRKLQVNKELEALSGWLYPAGEVLSVPCPIHSKNDLIVMSGTNAYIEDQFPHTLLMIDCDRVLTIDRDANGNVGISLTIRDKDDKVVVELDRGQFEINKNNYFKIHRRGSKSTLAVEDQYGQEVLYLHLANRNVLQFRALFNYKGRPIRIDDLHPFGINNAVFIGSCVGHSGITDVQIGNCLVR
jgi:hypothetical protein